MPLILNLDNVAVIQKLIFIYRRKSKEFLFDSYLFYFMFRNEDKHFYQVLHHFLWDYVLFVVAYIIRACIPTGIYSKSEKIVPC